MTRRHGTVRHVAGFAAVGALSTMAYVVLFAVLRDVMAVAAANALAMLVTAVANTAANRRFTFGVRSAEHRARHHAAGLLGFVTTLAMTSAALAALDHAVPHPSRTTEAAVLLSANAVATLVRFAILRSVLMPAATPRRRRLCAPAHPPRSPASPLP